MAQSKICEGCRRSFTPSKSVFVLCDACGGRVRRDSGTFKTHVSNTKKLTEQRRQRSNNETR